MGGGEGNILSVIGRANRIYNEKNEALASNNSEVCCSRAAPNLRRCSSGESSLLARGHTRQRPPPRSVCSRLWQEKNCGAEEAVVPLALRQEFLDPLGPDTPEKPFPALPGLSGLSSLTDSDGRSYKSTDHFTRHFILASNFINQFSL